MPQLDALTYFAQFIALVISFVASYALCLQFIIPNLVATQKLRQKLNSVALLTAKLNRSSDDFDAMANNDDLYALSEQLDTVTSDSNDLHAAYEGLATQNLSHYAKPKKPWLVSSRMAQLCQTLQQKKLYLSPLKAIGFPKDL